ncbi:flagellar biosynthesis protein FlhB [Oscillospiraceae bacterium OttesenSCG-928-F05]|nr:flagellar biosynthesis protein FlhB [Oscillospiraceae bacterium OttesenSCG-928-F05]
MAQSGEKTEKATPKRRSDARKKGNVLKSQDVTTAVTIVAMFAALALFGGYIGEGMMRVIRDIYSGNIVAYGDGSDSAVKTLFLYMIKELFFLAAPLFAVAVVSGVLVNLAQVGFLYTTEPVKPKLSKINPISGFKRLFSLKSLVELVKQLLKISVLGIIVYNEYMANFEAFPTLITYELSAGLLKVLDIMLSVAFKCAIAFVVIGALDYAYQYWQYEKDMKMTKQEVKDEYKQQEGDPKVKGEIKKRQRQMAMSRMMQSVPQADVIVTNPTHYAVALKYDENKAEAPVVLAKGKDLVAQRIKAIAAENGITMVENKPVAQALYASTEIGQEIPQNLFQAVAEILAYVYRQKNKKNARPERRSPRRQPAGR